MKPPTTGRWLGWLYGASLAAVFLIAHFTDEPPDAPLSPRVAAGLAVVALGFLGARWYYDQSAVFWLFFRVARMTAGSAEPEDKCLISFSVALLVAALFLVMALTG